MKYCHLKPVSDQSGSKDHSVGQLSTANPRQEHVGGRTDQLCCAGRAWEPLNAESQGSCQPLGCLHTQTWTDYSCS